MVWAVPDGVVAVEQRVKLDARASTWHIPDRPTIVPAAATGWAIAGPRGRCRGEAALGQHRLPWGSRALAAATRLAERTESATPHRETGSARPAKYRPAKGSRSPTDAASSHRPVRSQAMAGQAPQFLPSNFQRHPWRAARSRKKRSPGRNRLPQGPTAKKGSVRPARPHRRARWRGILPRYRPTQPPGPPALPNEFAAEASSIGQIDPEGPLCRPTLRFPVPIPVPRPAPGFPARPTLPTGP